MATGAVVARILTQYSAVGSKAAKRDIATLGKSFDKFAARATRAFAIAGAAGAAFAIKTGVDSLKAAMDDQKSQALLANSLRNTVGASDGAIASMEAYIGKLQIASGVVDDKLRPSLALLAGATGDLTSAQKLQALALDISADRGKDIETVSLALVKAHGGNLGALTKLGVKLSATTLKSKNFFLAQKELVGIFKGASATAADSMAVRLERLKIMYGEIQETLGYALLPVISKFANYLVSDVLPKIQAWVDMNKDKLAKSFQRGVELLTTFTKKAFAFGEWISNNMFLVKSFAAVIATMFVSSKVAAFIITLNAVKAAMVALGIQAWITAGATAFATGGISVGLASAALLAAGLSASIYLVGKNAEGAGKKMGANYGAATGFSRLMEQNAKRKAVLDAKSKKNDDGGLSTAKKLTAEQRALLVVKAALAKFGVVAKTETDPIQLEAARLNLIKQANVEELTKFERMKANLELQFTANAAVQRYSDILSALADKVISSEEVAVLAAKWGTTSAQVMEYVARIFAANSTPTDDSAILKLYSAWGLTKEQAQKYLDFSRALADEKLSPAEIEMLKSKWGLTSQAVLDYAALVTKGMALSPSFSAPGDSAKDSWAAALAAFNSYISATTGKVILPPPAVGNPYQNRDRNWDDANAPGVRANGVISYAASNGPVTASDYAQRNAGVAAMGGTLNINLAGYDPMGAQRLVQEAVQSLTRSGFSLAGGSSRAI